MNARTGGINIGIDGAEGGTTGYAADAREGHA